MDRTIVSSLACPIVSATWKMSESFHLSIWVFPKIGGKPPKWMVKIMENPIKMDDLGVPLFLETSISVIHPKTATCIGSI